MTGGFGRERPTVGRLSLGRWAKDEMGRRRAPAYKRRTRAGVPGSEGLAVDGRVRVAAMIDVGREGGLHPSEVGG